MAASDDEDPARTRFYTGLAARSLTRHPPTRTPVLRAVPAEPGPRPAGRARPPDAAPVHWRTDAPGTRDAGRALALLGAATVGPGGLLRSVRSGSLASW